MKDTPQIDLSWMEEENLDPKLLKAPSYVWGFVYLCYGFLAFTTYVAWLDSVVAGTIVTVIAALSVVSIEVFVRTQSKRILMEERAHRDFERQFVRDLTRTETKEEIDAFSKKYQLI